MSTSTPPLSQQTLESLLNSLAAKQPVPGGGAVAGITTALSASLGGMVVAYSLGKPSLADSQSMLENAASELEQAEADAVAYGRLNALWGLEKDDPDRLSGWTDAVEGAIKAPGEIMETADRILEILEELPGRSARHLGSDLAIAVELAATGARAAERNVAVNLPLLPEGETRNDHDARYGGVGVRVDERARTILEHLA
jgi:formiminotetrahydrofolate cyclodeaminase